MKTSLNWLKNFIDLNENAEEIAALLTKSGLEVEGIDVFETVKGGLEGLVVGEVLSAEKHPDADKLKLTKVDIGNGDIKSIVCGAPNVAAGQKVIVATLGATLYPTKGDPFQIKRAKIRGVESEGMICAEDEIGLGESHAGIMVLDQALKTGTPAAEALEITSDTVFEIGLTPNRADAASHLGVARDLRALLSRPLKKISVDEFKIDNHNLPIEVIVENTKACPRYSGLTISGLQVKESPDWLKNRLKSIGLSPINNVVDITNYILHELGQPLHAFDADEIAGGKVIVKNLPENTPFETLDGKERKLKGTDLMICNEKEGMCIAGVFGGSRSGVKESTKSIFLESAYFSPDSIRKTVLNHGLKTDASFRFERGADPNITVYALKRAAMLIKELTGGVLSSDIVDIYPEKINDFQFQVKYSYIKKLIGHEIEKAEIKRILNDLEITVKDDTEEHFTVVVSPYRVDVQRPADIVEEIIRVYGFDKIGGDTNLKADYLAEFPERDPNKIQLKITEMLAAAGFSEIITNSLTKRTYPEQVDFLNQEETIEVLNKLSEDLAVLRQTLTFSGLEVIAHNINRRQTDLRFFEFGKNYFKTEKGYGEQSRLALFMTGNYPAETWIERSKAVSFHDLSTHIYNILSRFNVLKYDTEVLHDEVFSYGLLLKVKNKPLVSWGKVAKKIRNLAEVKQEVFYADIDWDYLLKLKNDTVQYEEVSKFPEVRRDLSLVMNKQISFSDIRKTANKAESKLIKKMNVFDVYEGENIGADKKAYAISFILHDLNNTLTDKVIDKTMERLMKSFETDLGAIIRK